MATNTITSIYEGGMAFRANPKGHDVTIDLAPESGGNNLGTSPKILMLVSLAGCTGVDVVGILNKMRVIFTDLSIKVDGHLTKTEPNIYDEVVITYFIKVDDNNRPKVEKAVALSQDKYCGVSEMFRSFARLSHKIEFLP